MVGVCADDCNTQSLCLLKFHDDGNDLAVFESLQTTLKGDEKKKALERTLHAQTLELRSLGVKCKRIAHMNRTSEGAHRTPVRVTKEDVSC